MIIYLYGPLTGQDGKLQIKIGETATSVQERYAGTVMLDPKKVIKEITVPQEKVKKSLDKEIHKYLKSLGFPKVKKEDSPDGKSLECFYLDEKFVEDKYIANINRYLGKIESKDYRYLRTKDYGSRPEQQEAVDYAIKYFNNTTDKAKFFLFNAKPRFGKNYTTFKLVKEMGWKKVLIISHFPSTKNQWQDELLNHVEFSNYNEFILLDNNRKIEASKLEEYSVTYTSLQKLKAMNENDNWIYMVDWDLIVFDEIHYGEKTDIVKDILSRINYKNELGLSATPFDKLKEDVLTTDQQYVFSYVDEQKAKQYENANPSVTQHHKECPDMNILLVELKDSANQQISYNTLFALNEDKTAFHNEFLVETVFSNLGRRDLSENAISPFSNPEIQKLEGKNPIVSLIFVSETGIRDNLAKLLSRLPEYFKYGILPLDDTTGTGVDALESANEKIKKDKQDGKIGTILISVGKLTTGITLPELTFVMMMSETASAQEYIQKIFRAQSAWTKDKKIVKENCYIYDYSPENAARNLAGYLDGGNISKSFLKDMVKYSHVYSTSVQIMRQDFDASLTSRIPVDYKDLYEKARGIDSETVLLNKTKKSAVNFNKIIKASNTLTEKDKEKIVEFFKLQELYAKNSNVKQDASDISGDLPVSPKVYICNTCKAKHTKPFPKVDNKDGTITETCPSCGYSLTTTKPTKAEKVDEWFGFKEEKIIALLSRFIQSVVIYIYLSELKEENIDDVILDNKPDELYKNEALLFTRVTGITREMFKDIYEHLWNTSDLNDIILSIKKTEKNSINYLWPNIYGSVIYDKDFMEKHGFDIMSRDIYNISWSYSANVKRLRDLYFNETGHEPNVENSLDESGILLKYLANISNNIKFISPQFASIVVDMLAPQDDYEFWANPNHVYFDPFSTSGTILKEIARRIFDARTLEYVKKGRQMPPDRKRTISAEILNNQIWGVGQTALMSDVSRRSLYGTTDVMSPISQLVYENEALENILHFNKNEIDGNGNIWTWPVRKITETDPARAAEQMIDNNLADKHPFVYSEKERTKEEKEFVDRIKEVVEMLKQQGKKLFIVNNTPYYTDTSNGHFKRSASPLYHEFLKIELGLKPDAIVTIQPSRLFNSDKGGPKKFLQEELLGNYIENIERVIDFENSDIIFPGTDFAGGVHILKYNKNHYGPTSWTFFDINDVAFDGSTYIEDAEKKVIKSRLEDISTKENTVIRYLDSINETHMKMEDVLRDPVDFENIKSIMNLDFLSGENNEDGKEI
jgi:superfamily II DNA or RNA helicase